MKILPINNIQNNQKTQFRAKFPKQDVKQFLTEIEEQDRCAVPQLYTLLEFVKKLPQKTANIKSIGGWYSIVLDGKSLTGDRRYINATHALIDSVVIHKNTMIKDSPIERLSQLDFESKFYKNAKKSKQDVDNIFNE